MRSGFEGAYLPALIGFAAAVATLIGALRVSRGASAPGPNFVRRLLVAIAAYVVSAACVLAMLLALTGGNQCPDAFALPAVALFMLWVGLSVVWLIRSARENQLPAWAKAFGIVDWVLIAAIAACLVQTTAASASCV